MKIGIEEEYLVVDPETLQCIPGAFQLANALVYKDGRYVIRCGVELPLHPRSFRDILRHVETAFSVFEIKTEPYEDIDALHDELVAHRQTIAEIAKKNNLIVLPSGLHPLYSSERFIPDNCASVHVHVDNKKGVYEQLFDKIPFLISVSVNSPFVDGTPGALSNRLRFSPHVDVPRNKFRRRSDLIVNPRLNTVEVRVLDSQITSRDALGLASVIKAIAEQNTGCPRMDLQQYMVLREKAITLGSSEDMISDTEYQRCVEYNEFAKQFLEQQSGAAWQLDIYEKYGLSSVIVSLWESFCAQKRQIVQSSTDVGSHASSWLKLLYLVPYFPFFAVEKYLKYRQDMMRVSELLVSRLKHVST